MKTIPATMLAYMLLLASSVATVSSVQAKNHDPPGEDKGPLDYLAEHKRDIYKTAPLEKVVELLAIMNKKIVKEGKEEEKAYDEISKRFRKDETRTKKVVNEKTDEIAELQASLKEAEAFRAGKKIEVEKTANEIAKDEQHLAAARDGRKKERTIFEKNEAAFVESLDQLERALEVLKKKAPEAASASLLSIAQKLKKTLTQSSDFSLNLAQQDTLNSFVRTAASLENSPKTKGALMPAPSFIQEQSSAFGPYGDFESGHGGVAQTLEELQQKVQTEKDQQSAEENKARELFKNFEEGAERSIVDQKESKANAEMAIMQSQQQSSQDEASLQEAQQILKSESAHLQNIQEDYYKYTNAYKIRLRQRADENVALHEAQRVLSQAVYQSYLNNFGKSRYEQYSQTFDKPPNPNVVTSLLQLYEKKYSAKARALTFLAMTSTHKRRSASFDHPFSKVKNMIQGMLEKLQQKQHEETTKGAWCDKEQAKTAKEHERKTHDVEKTTDRLDALECSLSETIAEIETNSQDLKDLTASFSEAEELGMKTEKGLTESIKVYKDGIANLKRAKGVLTGYYEETAEKKNFQEVRSKGQKYRKGLSSGVIAILEIAIDDMEKMYDEAKLTQATSRADLEKLRGETEVRTAVFRRSLEHLNNRKVKLELDKSTMSKDLKSYQKELENINAYEAQLKSQCVVQGPSYEERKSKREKELASLKEALTALR